MTNHRAVQFHRDFTATRNQQGRVPQQRKPLPAAASIILLARQAQVSCVSIQAQYQAFVRFAVKSCAASKKPSRSNGPAFWNLSLGAGSRFENSGHHPKYLYSLRGIYGASNPGPTLWPERSRSRGIFQAVFLHPNRALWGLFAAGDRPPDTRQIGLGRPFAG